jgi:hypothetical protein
MLAYGTFYHQRRIDMSAAANIKKGRHIRRAIQLGLAAPMILALLFQMPIDGGLHVFFHQPAGIGGWWPWR